jgi:hypothetical protein
VNVLITSFFVLLPQDEYNELPTYKKLLLKKGLGLF